MGMGSNSKRRSGRRSGAQCLRNVNSGSVCTDRRFTLCGGRDRCKELLLNREEGKEANLCGAEKSCQAAATHPYRPQANQGMNIQSLLQKLTYVF